MYLSFSSSRSTIAMVSASTALAACALLSGCARSAEADATTDKDRVATLEKDAASYIQAQDPWERRYIVAQDAKEAAQTVKRARETVDPWERRYIEAYETEEAAQGPGSARKAKRARDTLAPWERWYLTGRD